MNKTYLRSICVFILALSMLAMSACAPAAPTVPAQQSSAPAQEAQPSEEPNAAPAAPAEQSSPSEPAEETEPVGEVPACSVNAGALVGVSLFSRRSQQELDLETGIREAAVKTGFSVIIEDADTDPARQVEQINSFVEKGVNAIIIDTTDDEAVKESVAAAKAAGISVVSVIVSATGADAHLGFDYSDDGTALAKWLTDYVNQNMGGSAKIGVVDFASCKLICQRKLAAIEEYLKANCPGAELVAKYDGKGKRSESMTACEKLLMKNPEINIVLVFNEEAAAAAADIVSDMKRTDVGIIGSAYGDEIFDSLSSGASPYLVVAADPYYTLGTDAVAFVDKLLSKESVQAETPYPAMLLNSDTIAEYDYKDVASKRTE